MAMVQRYQKRISGPLMDRIDIHLEVQRVPYQKLDTAGIGETSKVIRERIAAARQLQAERFAPLNRAQWAPDALVNSDIGGPLGAAEVQRFCELNETGQNLMRAAVQQMNLSARAYHRVLKLARTIANLAGEKNILPPHLGEALQYRPREIV